jgi:hypothetical protein
MVVDASFSFSLRRWRNRALAPALRFRLSSATLEAAWTSTGSWTGPELVGIVII